jgi:hypothetical protein
MSGTAGDPGARMTGKDGKRGCHIRASISYGPQPPDHLPWKQTNPGWPDPTDWINRLCASLQDRYAVYQEETDVLLRRNKAASMLAHVLSSLHELPPFHAGHSHLPLKDLLIFLSDLDRGRSPPWAQPVNFGGTSVTTTADSELRQWVNGVVHVLWFTGMRKTEAYKIVADGLTKHGRKGKGGGPVAWRSVQQWCRNLGHPKDTMIGRRIMDWWQVTPCPHGYLVTNCETGQWNIAHCCDAQAMARKFADSIWEMPHLRDRF